MNIKLLHSKVLQYFVAQSQSKLIYGTMLILSLFCFSESFSQNQRIPLSDGSFSTGNTFAANGWTVANEGTSPVKWALGTAASGFSSSGTTTSGSATVTLGAANATIAVGQFVYGNNIPLNTFVQNIVGTTLTLSQNATGSASGTILGFGANSGSVNVATSQLTTAAIVANTFTLTLSVANSNIAVGMAITPITGVIDANTYVASINGTALGLSRATLNSTALAVAQNLVFTATSSAITNNAAFISNDNGATNSYGGFSSSRTVYFYRDITTVPANEKAMKLTFDVKSVPNSAAGWQVWVAPITQNVVGADAQVTSAFTYGVTWPGATLISFNSNAQVSATKITAFVPKSFAGTSFRLIFVWTNTSTTGTLAPAAIDNISLTSRIPEDIVAAQSGLWSQPATWGGNVPTPADNAILLNNNDVVMIDSRYSGCEDLQLIGANTLIQYAISTVMDEFTINNDLVLVGSGSRFNNHDGTNGKYLRLGHNLDVSANARFDSSLGGTPPFQGRLKLEGNTVQTITVNPAGFVGGSAVGVNAFANVSGVLNQLEVTNTAAANSNIIWNANGIRIKSALNLISGRINITGTNRFVIGNFGSLNGIIVNPGSGFTNGKLSKWISNANVRPVQSGTEYPGTDVSYKPYWFPFINSAGLEHSLYFLPDANPFTGSEVAVTFTDVNTTTNALSIADGSYNITDRYNATWAFSTPDGSATGTPLLYAPNATTATNRLGLVAKGAFESIDGSARIMNLATALSGAHQDGTNKPFAFRKNIPFIDLTAAPLYMGVNVNSILNTTGGITSAASGNWNSPATWVGGTVPTCTNAVTIAAGHTVTVNSVVNVGGVVIDKNGTLTTNAGGIMTVGCTNNNAAFFNYGTFTISAGTLTVNGSISHKTGSTFNQTGGDIIVDSNNNGDIATSVAFGGSSLKIETSDLNLTAGKITIVDPLVNIGTPVTAQSAANFTINTAGATGTFNVVAGPNSAVLNEIRVSGAANNNVFQVGMFVSSGSLIPAGTTIQAVTTVTGPSYVLTLSNSLASALPANTTVTFTSMSNNVSAVVIEANAANANLAVGMGITGSGIAANTTITSITYITSASNTGIAKLNLSNPVTGLAVSPIDTVVPLQITVVSPGATSLILSAANPDIIIGMSVSGAGILPGTFVINVTGINVSLSEPIQAGAPSPINASFQSFNTLSSGSFIYDSPNHYATGINHTLQIGNGVSIQNSAVISNGFNCQFQSGGGLLSLGNLTVDAPNGNNRFLNVSSNNINSNYNMNVQNALTVTAGSVFKKTFSDAVVYVGGNIVNNGTINFPKGGVGLYLGNFINGAVVPTTLPQTISGSGIFDANQYYLANNTYISGISFPQIAIDNLSTQGVTLTVPNFRILRAITLVNGILHTSAATPIYIGDPNVLTATNLANITSGSATSYIEGPMVYAFNSTSTNTQYRLLPLGKNGKFLPIYMTTIGGVQITAEAFDTNTGTVNATNASNLSADRWKVSKFGTDGNITGYNVRLGSTSINSTSAIVHSATENGTYDIVSTPASVMTNVAATTTIPNAIQLTTVQTGGFLGNFAYAQGPACSGAPAPGATIASTTSVCSGMSVALSLTTPTTGANVTYQWQVSINGGATFTNIAGAESATYVATPLQDSSYLCKVTCGAATVASTPIAITTTVSTAVVTGATLCTPGTANLTASGSTILNWYDAATNGNLVATGTTYSPTVATTTSYYVASASESTNTANTAAYSGTASTTANYRGIAFDVTKKIRLNTVTVYPKNTTALTPITVSLFDANGAIVVGTVPVNFTPTLVTGTLGTVAQVVTLNYTIPVGTGYKLVATNGLATTTNILGNSAATITYPLTAGSLVLQGNVTSLNSAIVATANTTNCFHNLSYNEICESSSRVQVTATVVPAQTASISANTICSGNTGTVTFNGTANATITYTVNGGANQTVVLNAGGTASLTTPALTSNTTYALVSVTAAGASGCVQNVTTNATVVVTALPTASISGTTTICSGGTALISFSGTANATITYTVNGGANQTIVLNASGTASLATPSLTSTRTYALVSVNATCSNTASGTAIVTVANTPAPTGAATQDSCGTGTIAEFVVTGTNLIWYSDAVLNTVIPTTTTVVLNTTYYVSQTISGCQGPRLAILATGPCLPTANFEIAKLSYYPNPVTDQLTIDGSEIITKVELYNLLGQQLKTVQTDTEDVQLNIGEFPSSTYLVKVYSNQKVQTFRIIKK